MTYNQAVSSFYNHKIPLADIRTVIDGYFGMDFNSLGIHGEEDSINEEDFKYVLERLQSGYPAVYLSGYDIIRENKVFLTEDVLIPRTETIAFIYGYLKGYYEFNNHKVLDLCTGSGFIAMAIKSIYPDSQVTASDISDKALDLAKKSAKFNNLDISFLKSDFLSDINDTFDVIISNPPYIEEDSIDTEAPFEPELALYSGKDGCDSYRKIFSLLDKKLNKDGAAFFELEASNALKVKDIFLSIYPQGYEITLIKDMENKNRYLEVRKK
ncbi:MAG: peptide chain release factor N(5)-glutamine methyltransferase [Bacilli bacterium]